jgi:hypothetical protein
MGRDDVDIRDVLAADRGPRLTVTSIVFTSISGSENFSGPGGGRRSGHGPTSRTRRFQRRGRLELLAEDRRDLGFRDRADDERSGDQDEQDQPMTIEPATSRPSSTASPCGGEPPPGGCGRR